MKTSLDNLEIRPERPDEFAAIYELVKAAFGRDFEAKLVDSLRASDAYRPELILVALFEDVVVGHILITAFDFVAISGQAISMTILAPLAVAPSHQNRGIGTALTHAALAFARDAGMQSMILVGHPNYYPRFGFKPASTWGIRYSSPIPDDVFMAIELQPGALANAAGIVTLPAAFDEA